MSDRRAAWLIMTGVVARTGPPSADPGTGPGTTLQRVLVDPPVGGRATG
ncbi:MAG: hypothetical protein JNL82_30595 [Myxococcales bacterium]|nr:hypothetical protein [Myxococcales bacterium]